MTSYSTHIWKAVMEISEYHNLTTEWMKPRGRPLARWAGKGDEDLTFLGEAPGFLPMPAEDRLNLLSRDQRDLQHIQNMN